MLLLLLMNIVCYVCVCVWICQTAPHARHRDVEYGSVSFMDRRELLMMDGDTIRVIPRKSFRCQLTVPIYHGINGAIFFVV
jgi:hypothetical protein